jgi:hypothetical protein
MKSFISLKFLAGILIFFFILSCGKIKETVQEKMDEKINEQLEEELKKIDSVKLKLDSLDLDSILQKLDSLSRELKLDTLKDHIDRKVNKQ